MKAGKKEIDSSSNQIWKDWKDFGAFEQRSYRFTGEMRSLFFKWLGIRKNSSVLDAGCGTGVFGRYLAGGLTKGHVTGFDINENFIKYGQERLDELSLSGKVTLEVADGFDLHYEDDSFDAVTNYTYIGVLSDPVAGMKELIRVCRRGGVVSCVIASNNLPSVWWQGDYPFDESGLLQKLSSTEKSRSERLCVESMQVTLDDLDLFTKSIRTFEA